MLRSTTLVLAAVLAAPVGGQTCGVERLSVDGSGLEGDGASTQPAMTPDGRWVVFSSAATNLVTADSNGVADVFLRDLAVGSIERVTYAPGNVEPDAACSYPAISDDARFVAFSTAATNLAAGDTNGTLDVYVIDRVTGAVEWISRGIGGAAGDGPSFAPTLTPDGRCVMFVSWAGNLVAGDANATRDVFLYDRAAATLELVSVATNGAQGDDMSGSNSLLAFATPDGRFVFFGSMATTLVPGDSNQALDVFVRDRWSGTTALLVTGPGGGAPNGATDLGRITSDGRFVGFSSSAPDLVPGDTNGAADAFLLDRHTGVVERVSISAGGAEAHGDSWSPAASADGRFVVYSSAATDLVPLDTNSRRDAFRFDRVAGTVERFVLNVGLIEPQQDVFAAVVSAAGDRVAFAYLGDDCAVGDVNMASDVFVTSCAAGRAFCSGDGTAALCPCGSAGAWRGGCPNSVGAGATLSGAGSPRTLTDTLALAVRDMPPHTTVTFLMGSHQMNGGAGTQFGDGLRCLSGTIVRLGTLYAPDGRSSWGFGTPGAPPLALQSGVPLGGDVRYYQAWYRNPTPFCTTATHNLTNALEVGWLP